MGKRENKVETYLNDEVENLGGVTRKWVSPGVSGVPDRIVFYKGEIHLVEVKTIDGSHSPEQINEHRRLSKVGIEIHTVYGNAGVDYFVKEILLK